MAHLTESIVQGDLSAGEMLPREVDLAEQFNISRGTARETIRALEERGLVSVRHGRGATVNASDDWDLFAPEVLTAMLAGRQSGAVLAQYLECRRILEVEAVGLAAERAEERHVVALKRALDDMERVTAMRTTASEAAFHEADIGFHQAIFRAAHNQALASLVRRLHSALFLARQPLARPQFRLQRALPEHRAIYEAISARDPAAARAAMNEHLDTVARYLGEHNKGHDNRRSTRIR
jgi:GntR family transcriptional repressor for pyruvate dehydrogenase complex